MKAKMLILRDMVRRPARTILIVLFIALAVALTISVRSLTEATYEATRHELARFGANIRIRSSLPGRVTQRGGLFLDTATIPQATVERVRSAPHADMLRAIAPRLTAQTSLDGLPVNLVGITDDERLLRIWWRVDSSLLRKPQFPSETGVLLGRTVFERLGSPHELSVEGRSFDISGVLDSTGDEDDRSVFMDLAVLQQIAGLPLAVHTVEVASGCIACKDMDVYKHAELIGDALAGGFGNTLRVEAVRQVAEAQIGTLRTVERAAVGISVFILIMAGLLVAGDMISRVEEQRFELAVLRAIGMSRWRLSMILFSRGALLGLAGALAGAAVGTGLTFALGPLLLGVPAVPMTEVLIGAPLLAVLVAGWASLGPAIKGARLPLSTVLAEAT
jgi:putative ABC transport system permease protein